MAIGDRILRRIRTQPTRRDIWANLLLRQFARGYPIENLRQLLRSEEAALIELGVWLASELGSRARPLLEDVAPLLVHESPGVRFWAIDSAITCTTEEDGSVVAKVLSLLSDDESSVRFKAFHFLAAATVAQLRGGAKYLESAHPESVEVSGVHFLIGPDTASSEAVLALLNSEVPILRVFGLAAAVRSFQIASAGLQAALRSDDHEVKSLAAKQIQLMDPIFRTLVRKSSIS